jgi:hypothetical protein
MKVPPHKNLIVCVKLPQTIVRQCVLAAVSYVSALCGAVHAQLAPGPPPLFIDDAVMLSHPTQPGNTYAIERSTNLQSWQPDTNPVFGDGNEATRLLPVTPGASGTAFYRLRTDTRPVGGNAPWLIADSVLLLNGSEGPRSLIFNTNGGGALLQGVTNQAFTWEWLRTGLDSGTCKVTRSSGEIETIALQFTATGTGVFTSQRNRDGIPSGATAGTFRKVADSSLTTFMPATLGHALITLSGTGRSAGVDVKGDGTASVAGPAGVITYPCNYILKTATTAELRLNGLAPDSESYIFTFNGPACGTYTSKAKKNSVLRREATGAFTITPQ